ncbi:hypothetical protein EV356DRAFT_535296 [Viridothelium virens]|uniref:TPR-like protein n=1 Tax=Viridothelium virens TaxID=1048519 RepID=A0A6A6H0L1_VIRVR|nr:hypothetical protein EV356DRAFT_535296 [Viridothelium virens]
MAHRREISHDDRRRVPIPRRTTRGPLEDSDPLTDPDTALVSPPPSLSTPINTTLPGTSPPPSSASHHLSPNLVSPPPRASAGNHAPTPSTDHRALPRPRKDFSFLFNPTIYQPLPATTIPPPFAHSPHQPQPNTPLASLLSHGHFRHAAISCATTLTSGSLREHDGASIFGLFQTRLSCLLLLQLTPLAATESKALGDLTSDFYREDGRHVVPWGLRVLCVRLQALGFGDARRGVMGYYELGREARQEIVRLAREKKKDGKEAQEEMAMWKDRLRDLGVRVADALVEMGDLEGAGRYLATQRIQEEADEMQRMRMALVWLRVGDVKTARRYLGLENGEMYTEDGEKAVMNALVKVAEGDYNGALTEWQKLREQIPENEMVYQNLAVCLLYTGRISEARSLLEALIDKPASFHGLTFNLSTIYELCTEHSRDRKMELADRVAAHDPTELGWEKSTSDFKL